MKGSLIAFNRYTRRGACGHARVHGHHDHVALRRINWRGRGLPLRHLRPFFSSSSFLFFFFLSFFFFFFSPFLGNLLRYIVRRGVAHRGKLRCARVGRGGGEASFFFAARGAMEIMLRNERWGGNSLHPRMHWRMLESFVLRPWSRWRGRGGGSRWFILWRRGHEERDNGGICNGDIGARKKIIEVAVMLLSRLFGNKFLVDERFFHIFSLFSSLLFFFSLFDRTTMEFQLRFKRIIYFWNFSKCYENLFKILYRFGTCENTFARNNLLRLILWKIEILLAFLLTLRDTGGSVEQRHGKSWLLWIPSWGLKKARMQLTSS